MRTLYSYMVVNVRIELLTTPMSFMDLGTINGFKLSNRGLFLLVGRDILLVFQVVSGYMLGGCMIVFGGFNLEGFQSSHLQAFEI